jgi:transglutaminase-like putative cysteine protease
MPTFSILHVTKYEYDRPVKESLNEVRIFPYLSSGQEVLQQDLSITGSPEVHLFSDYYGNKTGVFNVYPPHQLLSIESKLLVRTTGSDEVNIDFHATFQDLEVECREELRLLELAIPDIRVDWRLLGDMQDLLKGKSNSVAQSIEQCSGYIFKHFSYIKGITDVETTVNEVLEKGAGVCQDFALVLLQMLRIQKIPCRYVSGYICPNRNGMRGEGATHAWVEAWIPGYGWAGIDPTNNIWVTNKHVKLSVGMDFNACSPVKGSFKGPAKQTLTVFVSIGYEDGGHSEDLHNIHQHSISTQPTGEVLEGSFAAQQ